MRNKWQKMPFFHTRDTNSGGTNNYETRIEQKKNTHRRSGAVQIPSDISHILQWIT